MNPEELTATSVDVERTARDTTVAQWGVASVVMVGSMAAGGFAFHHLHEPWGLGVVTAAGVDLALAVWLLISRRLRAVGVTSLMGFVLELTTMGMTLFLNVGAAVFKGVDPGAAKVLLGVAHSFLPVVLVLVSLAGAEAQVKLLRLQQAREARNRAERDAQQAAEQTKYEADQRRLATERQRDADQRERVRLDQIRAAELAATQQQRELADRREQRELADRHLAASVASVAILTTAWRHRPKRASQARPRSRPAAVPASRTSPVPVTDALMSHARRVRAERAARGESTGRAVLQRELKVPERTARELVRRLGDQPLRVLSGGR